jgi:hypothetical protein
VTHHGATTQKTTIFVLTAVRTSNPTYYFIFLHKFFKELYSSRRSSVALVVIALYQGPAYRGEWAQQALVPNTNLNGHCVIHRQYYGPNWKQGCCYFHVSSAARRLQSCYVSIFYSTINEFPFGSVRNEKHCSRILQPRRLSFCSAGVCNLWSPAPVLTAWVILHGLGWQDYSIWWKGEYVRDDVGGLFQGASWNLLRDPERNYESLIQDDRCPNRGSILVHLNPKPHTLPLEVHRLLGSQDHMTSNEMLFYVKFLNCVISEAQYFTRTVRRDRVGNTRLSYSGGSGFKSRQTAKKIHSAQQPIYYWDYFHALKVK